MSEYSVFDSNLPVDQDNFVVSIMRKPRGKESEHAFLMVEGRDSSRHAILKRYDLFIDENNTENRSKISITSKVVPRIEAESTLQQQFLKGEEVYCLTWNIKKEQAAELHKDIEKDKARPPKYQISGNRSLIAKSSSQEGHSCFSWAKEKLHNLGDKRIHLDGYSDFVAARTSSFIQGKREPTNFKCNIF